MHIHLRVVRFLLVPVMLASVCAAALGQLPPVTVTGKGVRDPVEKSYRKMVRGMDLFEQRRAMAPQATLSFKLLPRKRDTDMNAVRLDVVGREVDFNLPVAPDGTFTLPRNRQALAEDAVVTPNRRTRTMTWRTEIRTPGLPPGTRRLGDLRLECAVGMEAELISNNRSLFDRITGFFTDPPDYCASTNQRYLYFSERALFGVTLVHGGRRQILAVDRMYAGASADANLAAELPYCDCEVLLDRTYFLPLGDRSWPDDTLVEFEFMDGPPAPQPAAETLPLQGAPGAVKIGSSTLADLAAALGPMTAIRFDSGFTVAVHRQLPKGEGHTPELVVLFAPAGQALKARIRPTDGNPSP